MSKQTREMLFDMPQVYQSTDKLLQDSEQYIQSVQSTGAQFLNQQNFQLIKVNIQQLNNAAVDQMPDQSKFRSTYQLLLRAEQLCVELENFASTEFQIQLNKLKSLTYNNLGCYFNNRGKLLTALEYMEKVLQAERETNAAHTDTATTFLNICAVLSKLSRHQDALKYAEDAVTLLEKVDELDESDEITLGLLTAYYSYAVELDVLQRNPEAECILEKALEMARDRLGESHQQTIRIRDKLQRTRPTQEEKQDFRATFSDTFQNESAFASHNKTPIVLYQQFKNFNRVRYKLIILDKEHLRSIKVLAFPPNRVPILKLMINYETISEMCRISHIQNSLSYSLAPDRLEQCMDFISNLLQISGGKLQLQPVVNRSFAQRESSGTSSKANIRPMSAQSRMTTVTAEKEGAKFSVILASNDVIPKGNRRR